VALVRTVVARATEVALLLVMYAFIFLSPLLLPSVPYLSLIPVAVGVVVIPIARSLVFPGRAAAPILTAAILSGLLFTGVYLAAIDSAMRGNHGAVWPQPELIRSILIFAFSPYGVLGAACLTLIAYAGHCLGSRVRAHLQGRTA